MIERTIQWYSVHDTHPADGSLVITCDKIGGAVVIAAFYQNFDGNSRPGFYIMGREYKEIPLGVAVDFWASIDFLPL